MDVGTEAAALPSEGELLRTLVERNDATETIDVEVLLAAWAAHPRQRPLGEFLARRGLLSSLGAAKLSLVQRGFLRVDELDGHLLPTRAEPRPPASTSPAPGPAPPASTPRALARQALARRSSAGDTTTYLQLELPAAPAGETTATIRVELPLGVEPGDAGDTAVTDRERLGTLVCGTHGSVPLFRDSIVTIGRGGESDLCLPDSTVSRDHAQISTFYGRVRLVDCGSANGTLVNGELAYNCNLRHGDVLGCGPFEVQITLDRDPQLDEGEHTDRRRPAALTGWLEEIPLAELLQQLELNQRSGTLRIYAGAKVGLLAIQHGVPCWARFGELRDEDAVTKLLRVKAGRFSFATQVDAGPRTMDTSLMALMLNACRQADES